MKRIWIWSLGLLLSVPLWSAAQQTGGGRFDQQIQQDVTKLLQSKDRWQGITASTDDAIVTLSGTAKLLIDKMDAGRRVDRVQRVNGVRNHVEVEVNVPDEKL